MKIGLRGSRNSLPEWLQIIPAPNPAKGAAGMMKVPIGKSHSGRGPEMPFFHSGTIPANPANRAAWLAVSKAPALAANDTVASAGFS